MGPNDAELWRLAREHTRLEDESDSFAEEDGATERERDRLWQRKLAIAKRQEAIQARMTAIPPDMTAIPPDSIAGVRALARVLRRQAYCPGADVIQWRMAAEHIDSDTARALVDGLLTHGGPA